MFLVRNQRQPGHVLAPQAHAFGNAIVLGIGASSPNSTRIKIESFDGPISKFSGSNRENSRTSANVQERLPVLVAPTANELFQTEARGWMLACAKTQPRIQGHDRLAFPRPNPAPTRSDQQSRANGYGAEMTLPCFRPVFTTNPPGGYVAGAHVKAAATDFAKPIEQLSAFAGRPTA